MFRPRTTLADHPPFTDLPVRQITIAGGKQTMAVHVAGKLDSGRTPVICVPGYHRNMADYGKLSHFLPKALGGDWPVVLVDLLGRGRSGYRDHVDQYGSPADADDLATLADALGITRAVIVGQGYGGQVAMLLASVRPTLIAGTILIDAGPVTDPRGIVRLRNNLRHLTEIRGQAAIRAAFRHMLSADYPGTPEAEIDRLAMATHFIDNRGRAQPLFDRRLLQLLDAFDYDDILVAQWHIFDALSVAPLMMFRTQLTDQLRRETFEEMMRRRPDATALILDGQGSPALLDQPEEIEAIAEFVRNLP